MLHWGHKVGAMATPISHRRLTEMRVASASLLPRCCLSVPLPPPSPLPLFAFSAPLWSLSLPPRWPLCPLCLETASLCTTSMLPLATAAEPQPSSPLSTPSLGLWLASSRFGLCAHHTMQAFAHIPLTKLWPSSAERGEAWLSGPHDCWRCCCCAAVGCCV